MFVRRREPRRDVRRDVTASMNAVAPLTEVRHERGQNTAKSLGISLGNGRVCTTFAIEFEPLGEAEAELLEERFLLGSRFGDTA